jgi:hypothetical protein
MRDCMPADGAIFASIMNRIRHVALRKSTSKCGPQKHLREILAEGGL